MGNTLLPLTGFWCAAAVVMLFALGRVGCLSPRTFAGIPPRRTGLVALDLPIGFLVLLMSMLVASLVFGPYFPDSAPDSTSPSPTQPSALAFALAGLGAQILAQGPLIAFILITVRRQRGGLIQLGVFPTRLWRDIRYAMAGLFTVIILLPAVNLLVKLLADQLGYQTPSVAHRLLEVMLTTDSPTAKAVMIGSAILIAPPLEELIYRGFVQTTLLDLLGPARRWTTIFAASVIFTLIHLGAVNIVALPVLYILAITLGWLYERTASLWPGILVHALFNLVNVWMAMHMTGDTP